MTLAEIELDVFRRLDYADVPPPSVKARVNSYINQRHAQILASDRMRPLRLSVASVMTVPGQSSYALPEGCARVVTITSPAHQFVLSTQTLAWYRKANPDALLAGTPDVWIPAGQSAVMRRRQGIATIPGLWISGMFPETGITFTVTALLGGGGFYSQPTIALNNGTPLPSTDRRALASAFFTNGGVSDVTEFIASAPVSNAVWLWDVPTGGTPLSQINRLQTHARFYRFILHPSPVAAEEVLVDFEREIQPLKDPGDVPLLPLDFHDLLCLYARLDEYRVQVRRPLADADGTSAGSLPRAARVCREP